MRTAALATELLQLGVSGGLLLGPLSYIYITFILYYIFYLL